MFSPSIFSGYAFEALVKELIEKDLADAGYDGTVKVQFVEGGPQRGRDIEVTAPSRLRLWGIDFCASASDKVKVLVECKYSDSANGQIFQNFASNAAQNARGDATAFVLVTNNHLTPGALYEFRQLFLDKKTRPWIVDASRLENLLDASDADELGLSPGKKDGMLNGVAHKLQADTRALDDQTQEITISLINTTGEHKSGRLNLQSTREWVPVESSNGLEWHFSLPPYGFDAHRLILRRDIPDQPDAIRLALRVEGGFVSLETKVKLHGRVEFATGFYGKAHFDAMGQISQTLLGIAGNSDHKDIPILSISGATGTGKSRVMEEVKRNGLGVKTHSFKVISYRFGSLYEDAIQRTEDELRKERIFIPTLPERRSETDLISAFLAVTPRKGQTYVLVLDNVHNASPTVCTYLSQLVEKPPPSSSQAALIIIGRSDHSHGNVYFDRLLENLRRFPQSHSGRVELDRLDEQAFSNLLAELLPHVVPAAAKAIEELSARVPEQVIQCVEWLMDQTRLQIRYRAASGITDVVTFNRRFKSLPNSMTAVLADRFGFLSNAEHGKAAQLILAAAALLGASPPPSIYTLCGIHAVAVERLLCERHFLTTENNGSLAWCHESLLLHFRNWLLGAGEKPDGKEPPQGWRKWPDWSNAGIAQACEVARELWRRPDLLKSLASLDTGLIAALAGEHQAAVEFWRDLMDVVDKVQGWSTADVDGALFPYMSWAFDSVAAVAPSSPLLPKLAKTMTYVGGYCRSLADGVRAANFAQQRLARLKKVGSPTERIRVLFWIRAMVAHFRLDAGHVRCCLGELFELQAEYASNPKLNGDAALGYEVYNCLGMLFGYFNHRVLAEHYFSLADVEVARLQDSTLPGKQANDRSPLYQYFDVSSWERLCALATQQNAEGGTQRHLRHAQLGDLLVAFHLLAPHNEHTDWRDSLESIYLRLGEIEKECTGSSYYSVVPRIYVLKAALLYVMATNGLASPTHNGAMLAEAERLSERGSGICLERGIGYAHWQFANLRAMIALRRGDEGRAYRELSNAFENLWVDGLLFLGMADLSCANQLVLANYIKLLDRRKDEGDVARALSRISTYNQGDWSKAEAFRFAQASARKHHALLANRQPPNLLLDTAIDPHLALVAWF